MAVGKLGYETPPAARRPFVRARVHDHGALLLIAVNIAWLSNWRWRWKCWRRGWRG